MKNPSTVLTGLVAAGAGIVCFVLGMSNVLAAESEADAADMWREALIHPFDAITLSDQHIDRFLTRLEESDPERAAELKKMRITNPQQFRWEIREEIANRFFRQIKPTEKPETPKETPPVEAPPPPKEPDAAKQKLADLTAWLETHFPQQAEALKSNPAPSAEHLDTLFARYEPIMRLERVNPPLAEAMLEDIKVQMRRDELLMELQYAEEDEKEAIIKELESLVAKRFDLIIRKRQLQHDHLSRRLNRLQEELEKQRQGLEALQKTKEQSVKARVEALLKSVEKAPSQ